MCPRGRNLVGLRLERVRERLERRQLPVSMRRGLSEDPVGEPRVPRQEGPVKVRPDDTARPAALDAALAVVPEACDYAAERLSAVLEVRATRVVLEPREH